MREARTFFDRFRALPVRGRSEDSKAQRRAYARARLRRESLEDRAKRLARLASWRSQRKAAETPEQRVRRLETMRAWRRRVLASGP